MTVLQDTDGQFIGLSVAEDLAFALENDVTSLEEMKSRVHKWAEKLDLLSLLSQRPHDCLVDKAAGQSGWCLD